MRNSQLLKAALAAGIVAILHTPSYADLVYGVDTKGGVYAISVTESSISYNLLARDEKKFGSINALALDNSTSTLYFRSGIPSEGTGALYSFNLLTNQFSATEVLAASVFGGDNYNAAWYDGHYWAIREGTDTLLKINVGTGTVVGSYDLDGTRTLEFGDIAITEDGILYGSTHNVANEGFFKVDISGGTPGTPVVLNQNIGRLQISFNNDDTFLYGQFRNNNTLGTWYKVDTSGTLTNIGTANVGFNDLAGPRRIPEPGTLGLLAMGTIAGGLALRRRK